MTATSPADVPQTRNPNPAIWALTGAAGGATALIATAITTIAANPLPILEWLLIAAVASIGAWLAVYDFRERRLPNRLVWPLYAVTGVLVASCGLVTGALALALGWWGIIPALLGAAAAYVLALPHAAIHAAGRRGRQIPFGPYMVAGTVAVALWQILTTS